MGPGDLSLSVSSLFFSPLAMLLLSCAGVFPPKQLQTKDRATPKEPGFIRAEKAEWQAGSCEMMLVLPCHTQLLLPRLNLMRNAVRDTHTLVAL